MSNLVLYQVALIDILIQGLFYAISSILKTEQLYDISGTITYITAILYALLYRPDDSTPTQTQITAAVLVCLWTLRLGVFLLFRVFSVPDKRFDNLKQDPLKFLVAWVLQVVWIFVTPLPVYILLTNAEPSSSSFSGGEIGVCEGIGIGIWAFGFMYEAISDYQKYVFKKSNPGFMRSGLFKYSRYPNYFGEIVIWVGMFVLCGPGLEGWQYLSVISPLAVFVLLRFGSGVPLLEASGMKKYGNDEEYLLYKANTSLLIPWFVGKKTTP